MVETMALPPGFRFYPTDEELVNYYLRMKIGNREVDSNFIPELDLYKCEPWDISDKYSLSESEWYFFSPLDKKYPNGGRTNRATAKGYWKATGKDRPIYDGKCGSQSGMKKTLVFYQGRAPKGIRTDWIMHEYRLEEQPGALGSRKDAFVLCRIFNKKGDLRDSSPATGVVAKAPKEIPQYDTSVDFAFSSESPGKADFDFGSDFSSYDYGDGALLWGCQ